MDKETQNAIVWRERIEEFQKSGISQRQWCAKHAVKRGALRYWLRRTAELKEGTEIRFARIVVKGRDHQ
mgnify:CR=1 FL=1|jgi:hypothetical protein